ncbi:MAG TPA: ABC transporter permease [Thermoanaerobacterales bacterium]|nr:ABC transporter permease [Thermoanaerobacterales bacterium]
MNIVNYFIKQSDKIFQYTVNHISLILIGITCSLILWVSIGIAIRNHSRLANIVLGAGSFIMSVPSISLYGILMVIPGLGISRKSAVIGLVLYSMLPIIRNVYTALNSTDPAIIEAARGVGMTSKDVLWKIRLPMALPIIFAGVRVAVVMMVGVATLAVYIGEKNLGRLLTHGIERTYTEMIITGAIMVSLIAIVIDYIMGYIQERLVSPGLKNNV